jgi:hypothetical protein
MDNPKHHQRLAAVRIKVNVGASDMQIAAKSM